MANAQTAGSAREASVGDEGTLLAEVHALDVRCGIEHLLHARSALRTFMSDDHTVAAFDLSSKNALTSSLLRVEHLCGSTKLPY